jgi:hypothetical protein
VITRADVPACAICDKPVPLEIAKADEDGKSVHEQCYVRKLQRDRAMTLPTARKWLEASAAIPWTDG